MGLWWGCESISHRPIESVGLTQGRIRISDALFKSGFNAC